MIPNPVNSWLENSFGEKSTGALTGNKLNQNQWGVSAVMRTNGIPV